jgi:CheY-like chemotaxis protein
MEYKGRILIVDDQLSVREVLQGLLMEQGYDLVFASHGPEALASAVELIPDLILLDVMMPGMDGFELCRQMRAHPILAEVPIIMVTALDDIGSVVRGLEAELAF